MLKRAPSSHFLAIFSIFEAWSLTEFIHLFIDCFHPLCLPKTLLGVSECFLLFFNHLFMDRALAVIPVIPLASGSFPFLLHSDGLIKDWVQKPQRCHVLW